ncbi:MAG: hypothetical protein AAGA92_10655 [Planctomycetota bacterium]
MARALAIRLDHQGAELTVVGSHLSGHAVEGRGSVSWRSSKPSERGRQLADEAERLGIGKAPVVVLLPSAAVDWQVVSLPPSPDEDLPDMLRLQLQREPTGDDAGDGVDFVPLTQDPLQPRELLAAAVDPEYVSELQATLEAGKFKSVRAVPGVLGWYALAAQCGVTRRSGDVIAIALGEQEAVVWAAHEGRLLALRSLQTPRLETPDQAAAFIANQIKRTRLAMASEAFDADRAEIVLLGGEDALSDTLAAAVSDRVGSEVQLTETRGAISDAGGVLAAAALAADAADGKRPLVDLLNPRRAEANGGSRRTMVLAAAALAALLVAGGLQGYSKVRSPLEAAASADTERAVIQGSIDSFEDEVRQAAAVREWIAGGADVLDTLSAVSSEVRPVAPRAAEFDPASDVYLTGIELRAGQLDIDARARTREAVQPLESRIRESGLKIRREDIEEDDSVEDYPWKFSSSVEVGPEVGP